MGRKLDSSPPNEGTSKLPNNCQLVKVKDFIKENNRWDSEQSEYWWDVRWVQAITSMALPKMIKRMNYIESLKNTDNI